MMRKSLNIPLGVQVGVVAALFLSSLMTLWYTWSSVVAREGRRASAKDLLDRAGESLARRSGAVLGRPEFATTRWPYYQDSGRLETLDAELGREADRGLAGFEGVEGGYYVRELHRFVGTSSPPGPPPAVKRRTLRRPSGPPPRETDLIEIQVDAAIRKDQVLFVVEDVPPSTVAIRTAPVRVHGQVVGATWTMMRLVDPLFLDRSLRGYRASAALALAGIALALLLTARLARTVRHQAIDRSRLQVELRRSERLAALGKLLAGVAHEVRNPLAGIRSTVQLWQRGIGPDAESFENLQAEVDRLEAIVARLLHFSRAETQELVAGDLNQVVAEAARLARGPAGDQGVRVELDLAAALPPVAMAPAALMQVFRNLTSNALQAMPEGGTLRLSTRRSPTRQAIEASVTDTGPGLAPDALAHLFEPFFTTKADGTGLGLAIAREIVLAHRGEVTARNRAECPGAKFVITLPAAGSSANGASAHGRA